MWPNLQIPAANLLKNFFFLLIWVALLLYIIIIFIYCFFLLFFFWISKIKRDQRRKEKNKFAWILHFSPQFVKTKIDESVNKKKSHTYEGGAYLRISVWHLLMNLNLFKKLMKWAN